MPSLPTPAAPKGPGIDAECPEKRALPAGPLDLEAALVAIEHATTEEEVMVGVATFLASATAFPPDTDPFAVLTALFGSECVTAVTEAGAEAVVELEAEAAATGGALSARAASRIARGLVHRVAQRAGRTSALPMPAHRALRVRVLRAPRAPRTPRRAVRLSAVASAGSGSDEPSPEPPGVSARAQLPDGKPTWSARTALHRHALAALLTPTDVERALANEEATGAASSFGWPCATSAGRRPPALAWLAEALPPPEATL